MIKLSTQSILVKNRETHEFEPIDNIGFQGESLYEIAVKEGFTGTKQEFLDSFQVVVSDEQPTSDYNKIWLDETSEDVEVPSIEEFNELKEIAGAIFAGAVNAGYTGTPEEFGAALAGLISG